jgi:hypothetical protein
VDVRGRMIEGVDPHLEARQTEHCRHDTEGLRLLQVVRGAARHTVAAWGPAQIRRTSVSSWSWRAFTQGE